MGSCLTRLVTHSPGWRDLRIDMQEEGCLVVYLEDRSVHDCALRVSKLLLTIYCIIWSGGSGIEGKIWPKNFKFELET